MKTARIVNIVPRHNDPEKNDYLNVGSIKFFGAKQSDGSYEDFTDDQIKGLLKTMRFEIMGGSYPAFLNTKPQDSSSQHNEFPDL